MSGLEQQRSGFQSVEAVGGGQISGINSRGFLLSLNDGEGNGWRDMGRGVRMPLTWPPKP